jgi:hypothetical protein
MELGRVAENTHIFQNQIEKLKKCCNLQQRVVALFCFYFVRLVWTRLKNNDTYLYGADARQKFLELNTRQPLGMGRGPHDAYHWSVVKLRKMFTHKQKKTAYRRINANHSAIQYSEP